MGDQVEQRGAIDFVNGVKVGDNPYPEDDARHWIWLESWLHIAQEKIDDKARSTKQNN